MTRTRAIVTLTLGENYQRVWQKFCRANWEQYAARHDADLFVFEHDLDDSPRAHARQKSWQKLLVLGQPQVRAYAQVVWLDADVLIHPRAPWIGEDVPFEKVGAADEYGYPTPAHYHRAILQLYQLWKSRGLAYGDNPTPHTFYRVSGFESVFDYVVQAGIMVLAPKHHHEIFEHVYFRYEEGNFGGLNAEMRPLSYELLKADCVYWLAPRWNALWLIEKQLRYPFLFSEVAHPLLAQCLTRALSENYMLHCAGAGHEVAYIDWRAPQLQREPTPRVYSASIPPTAPRCETPVALILFNRPETTARVMDAIRAARPRQLFLIADGARADHPDEAARCAEARAIAWNVQWECEVFTNFAETNLGLKSRVETGLDWVFAQVERAIILEDDSVPHVTFFSYCAELLERYRDADHVMAISGNDFKFGLGDNADSYTFSRYPLIWGWATWRRAWQLHDPNMTTLPHAIATSRLEKMLNDPHAAQYWAFVLHDNFKTQTTWDAAWLWSIWEHDGLCIHPNVNLIENVGFGSDATHTHNAQDFFANLYSEPIQFPLRHPEHTTRDAHGDALIEEIEFSGSVRRLWERVRADRRARKMEAR